MRVRPFRPADAPALAELFHRSVRKAGLRHYTPEQVRAWSPTSPDPVTYLGRTGERTVFVAVDDDDRAVGYGELGPEGHIDHLYFHPDDVGRGTGSELLDASKLQRPRTVRLSCASKRARDYVGCSFGLRHGTTSFFVARRSITIKFPS